MNKQTASKAEFFIHGIMQRLADGDPVKNKDSSGVLRIAAKAVKCEPFQGRDDVRLKDIVTLEESPRIGAGIMELDHADFPWTLIQRSISVPPALRDLLTSYILPTGKTSLKQPCTDPYVKLQKTLFRVYSPVNSVFFSAGDQTARPEPPESQDR